MKADLGESACADQAVVKRRNEPSQRPTAAVTTHSGRVRSWLTHSGAETVTLTGVISLPSAPA